MTKLGLQLTFAALTFAATEATQRPKPAADAPPPDLFTAAPAQEKARPALVVEPAAKKAEITVADKCDCKCDCGKTGACKCKAGSCPCDCGCAKGKPCGCNDGWYQSTNGSWYYLRAGKIVAAFDPDTGKYYRKDKGGEWGPWEDGESRSGPTRTVQPAARGSSRSC